MRIKARAKINWALNVQGERPDGYHELDMLNQRLFLSDDIELYEAEDISLTVSGAPGIPEGEENLVWRAARLMQSRMPNSLGVSIHLHKRIPSGAGLGGGSADAAAVLMGLNRLWKLGLSLEDLRNLGLSLGADVPYCLAGGFARVRGIGEHVTSLPHAPRIHLVLIQPVASLSTKAVFRQLKNHPAQGGADIPRAAQALALGQLDDLPTYARNQLQPAAQALCPDIEKAKEALLAQGAVFSQMTGAGSVVLGVFRQAASAKKAHEVLSMSWKNCILTESIPY